jgi:hypothetical protein
VLLSLDAKPCHRAFDTFSARNSKDINILSELENVACLDLPAKHPLHIVVLGFCVLARNCNFKNKRGLLRNADRMRRDRDNSHDGAYISQHALRLCKRVFGVLGVKLAGQLLWSIFGVNIKDCMLAIEVVLVAADADDLNWRNCNDSCSV